MSYATELAFPPISNREDLYQLLEFFDDDTGDAIDLSPYSFSLEIRRTGPNLDGASGYTPTYDYGSYNDYGPVIKASLGSGLTIIDTGILELFVAASTIKSLNDGNYKMAMTVTDGTYTRQVFLGWLPVYFGGVS